MNAEEKLAKLKEEAENELKKVLTDMFVNVPIQMLRPEVCMQMVLGARSLMMLQKKLDDNYKFDLDMIPDYIR